MTQDRQWQITKIVGSVLALCTLVSVVVGASNLVTSLRRDIDRNEESINVRDVADEKKWDKITAIIEKHQSDISELEKVDTKMIAQYGEILRRLDDNKASNKENYNRILNFITSYDYENPKEG